VIIVPYANGRGNIAWAKKSRLLGRKTILLRLGVGVWGPKPVLSLITLYSTMQPWFVQPRLFANFGTFSASTPSLQILSWWNHKPPPRRHTNPGRRPHDLEDLDWWYIMDVWRDGFYHFLLAPAHLQSCTVLGTGKDGCSKFGSSGCCQQPGLCSRGTTYDGNQGCRAPLPFLPGHNVVLFLVVGQ
jgi:hypothetical protein